MTLPFRIALYGFGYVGQRVAQLLNDRRRDTGIYEIEIAAVIDFSAYNRQLAEQAFPSAVVCEPPSNMTRFCRNYSIQGIKVGIPSDQHAELCSIQEAEKDGVKVLYEKPCWFPFDSVRIASGESRYVNMVERYNPVIQSLISRLGDFSSAYIHAVRLNTIFLDNIEATSRFSIIGGSLIDKMIHDIDIFVNLLGEDVELHSINIHDVYLLPKVSCKDITTTLNAKSFLSEHTWEYGVDDPQQAADGFCDLTIELVGKSKKIRARLTSSWIGIDTIWIEEFLSSSFRPAYVSSNYQYRHSPEIQYQRQNAKLWRAKRLDTPSPLLIANLQSIGVVNPFISIPSSELVDTQHFENSISMLESVLDFFLNDVDSTRFSPKQTMRAHEISELLWKEIRTWVRKRLEPTNFLSLSTNQFTYPIPSVVDV